MGEISTNLNQFADDSRWIIVLSQKRIVVSSILVINLLDWISGHIKMKYKFTRQYYVNGERCVNFFFIQV